MTRTYAFVYSKDRHEGLVFSLKSPIDGLSFPHRFTVKLDAIVLTIERPIERGRLIPIDDTLHRSLQQVSEVKRCLANAIHSHMFLLRV
jgi:hypothetical protein